MKDSTHPARRASPLLHPAAPAFVAVLLAWGCEGPGDRHVFALDDADPDAVGTVEGRAFFDLDGSGIYDGLDAPLAEIRLSLFAQDEAGSPLAVAESDAAGAFRIGPVPAAVYRLEVDSATVPDSLRVRSIDPEVIQFPPDQEEVEVDVAISFPAATVREARALPEAERVFVEGVALNTRDMFADNSVHIRADGRAIRAVGVPPPGIVPGDRVRFRARTSRANDQPVLDDVTSFVLQAGGGPSPAILTASDAASARQGDLDAELVRVRDARIVASSGDATNWHLEVDDGSGVVEASIRLANLGLTRDQADDLFVEGREMTLTGLLIPAAGTNRWHVHPRTRSDVAVVIEP